MLESVAANWGELQKAVNDSEVRTAIINCRSALLLLKPEPFQKYLRTLLAALKATEKQGGDPELDPRINPQLFTSRKAILRGVLNPIAAKNRSTLEKICRSCQEAEIDPGFGQGVFERAKRERVIEPVLAELPARIRSIHDIWPKGAAILLTSHPAILTLQPEDFCTYREELVNYVTRRHNLRGDAVPDAEEIEPLSSAEEVMRRTRNLHGAKPAAQAEGASNSPGAPLERFRAGVEALGLDFRLTVTYLWHIGILNGRIGENNIRDRSVRGRMAPHIRSQDQEHAWEATHAKMVKIGVIRKDGESQSLESDTDKLPKPIRDLMAFLSWVRRRGDASGSAAIRFVEASGR